MIVIVVLSFLRKAPAFFSPRDATFRAVAADRVRLAVSA
jgi:hypothetical protein